MVYDCIIVGAGPAGLSAAVYMARFNRKTLVIDKGYGGRSSYFQVNENYLGFPEGVHAQKLRELGKKQAQRFGVEFLEGQVEEVAKDGEVFALRTDTKEFRAKTLIFATGVVDEFPPFPGVDDYVGKSIFWCMTCDGYKMRDKDVLVVGHDDEAVSNCLEFLVFTKNLTFLTNCAVDRVEVEPHHYELLKKYGIKTYSGVIKSMEGKNGFLERVTLEDGTIIPTTHMFCMQGAIPNSYLAQQLGVKVNEKEYIIVNTNQETTIPGVYACGDVTALCTHQVAAAVYQGAAVAESANYYLYPKFQK